MSDYTREMHRIVGAMTALNPDVGELAGGQLAILRDCERDLHAAQAERDHWIRLFNRLEAAISHHQKAARALGFEDTHDGALYAARARIVRDAAEPRRKEPRG